MSGADAVRLSMECVYTKSQRGRRRCVWNPVSTDPSGRDASHRRTDTTTQRRSESPRRRAEPSTSAPGDQPPGPGGFQSRPSDTSPITPATSEWERPEPRPRTTNLDMAELLDPAIPRGPGALDTGAADRPPRDGSDKGSVDQSTRRMFEDPGMYSGARQD